MRLSRYLLPAVTLLICGVFIASVRSILLPFILAGVLAYLANPILNWFEIRGALRDRMTIVLYLALSILL